MRAAIYARYSSENQRDASIDDQVEVCRRLIAGQGWTVEKIYSDRAVSGASRFRDGYRQLLADAEKGTFEVVVCEALDRLGRKLADVAEMYDRLSFRGIRLFSVATGEITTIHIGLLGTMAQLYLSDLREKTWRGQLGRARAGKIPGGRAYGYDIVTPEARQPTAGGERRINPTEAAIVRRIYAEYDKGSSPRTIAKRLNAEGIPGPNGRAWGDTTIRGQVARGTGILNNPIYAGRLEWNRTSYIKDPRTGKRVARVNPQKLREVVDIPELRIVDDGLWQRVKARQAAASFEIGRDAAGNALNRLHRQRFLFSGLLKCGTCGGGYTIVAQDRYGCATHRGKGTCANDRTISRHDIEQRILSGLKERLLAPELVEVFVAEYRAEAERLLKRGGQAQASRQRELQDVQRKIDGIIRAIEDGAYSAALKERLAKLENQKVQLKTALDADTMPEIRMHPKLPEVYRKKVEKLEDALNSEPLRDEAIALIRSLVDRIVLTPAADRLNAELYGDLAAILAMCEGTEQKRKLPGVNRAGSQLSVVAGAGFEPATFRL